MRHPTIGRLLTLGVNLLVYLRASSDDQPRSCPQQAKECQTHAREEAFLGEGVEVGHTHSPEEGIYVDDGVSGWLYAPDERQGCNALINYCEANPRPADDPGLILVWELSRFGRFKGAAQEAVYWIHRLSRSGWRIRSVTQPGLDSTESDERLLRIVNIALESEKDTAASEEKSRRVKRGIQDAIERGIWAGGIAPFGFIRRVARISGAEIVELLEELPDAVRKGRSPKTDCYTILESTDLSSWVVRVFHWYVHGDDGSSLSLNAVARNLNENDVPTRKDGAHWRSNTVRRLLQNPAYMGFQEDEAGELHNALWDSVVDPDLWYAAQEKLRGNRSRGRGAHTVYLLSGLLRCASCGEPYHGDRNSSSAGDLLYYRVRPTPTSETCESCRKRIPVDLLDEPVIQAVAELGDHPRVVEAVESEIVLQNQKRQGDKGRITEIEAELRTISRKVERLAELYGEGNQELEEVQRLIGKEKQKEKRLESERDSLLDTDGRAPFAEYSALAGDFKTLIELATPSERKDLVSAFVTRIEVHGEEDWLRIDIRDAAEALDGLSGSPQMAA